MYNILQFYYEFYQHCFVFNVLTVSFSSVLKKCKIEKINIYNV